jgi:hypothetical protein
MVYKHISAKLKLTPTIEVRVDLDGADEMNKATIINQVRREIVGEYRKVLERLMVSLDEKDLTFELIERGN